MKTTIIFITGFVLLIIILIMKKRIVRFLRKIGLWKKAKEFKDKPVPVEPEKPTDPVEEPELPPIEEPEPPAEKPFIEEWDDPIILESEPEDALDVYDIIISSDPEVDQAQSISEQIAKVPDGTIERPNIIKFPEGSYWTENQSRKGQEGVIKIENRHNLIIEGAGIDNFTVFYTKAPAVPHEALIQENQQSERRHFWFIGCSNIKTRYIEVKGSNYTEGNNLKEGNPEFWKGHGDWDAHKGFPAYHAPWEAEHAFAFHDSKYMVLEHFRATEIWGDGVYVGNSYPDGSQHITIRDGHIRWAGRQGVAVSMGENILIERVFTDDGRRASIDLEPHLHWLKANYVKIRNCKLHSMQTVIAAVGNGDVSNVLVEDNEWSGGNAIICYDSRWWNPTRRGNWIVRNNKRTDWFGSPIGDMRFQFMDNILIENNTTQVDGWQSKISTDFEYCTNVKVINNAFGGGERIRLVETPDIVIKGNTPAQETFESIADYNR